MRVRLLGGMQVDGCQRVQKAVHRAAKGGMLDRGVVMVSCMVIQIKTWSRCQAPRLVRQEMIGATMRRRSK